MRVRKKAGREGGGRCAVYGRWGGAVGKEGAGLKVGFSSKMTIRPYHPLYCTIHIHTYTSRTHIHTYAHTHTHTSPLCGGNELVLERGHGGRYLGTVRVVRPRIVTVPYPLVAHAISSAQHERDDPRDHTQALHRVADLERAPHRRGRGLLAGDGGEKVVAHVEEERAAQDVPPHAPWYLSCSGVFSGVFRVCFGVFRGV